jgi:hypothetical protein
MKYGLDTEFQENTETRTVDLISIGIIAEDGQTLYAQSAEYLQYGNPSAWLTEHVIPHLGIGWTEIVTIKEEIIAFLDPVKYGNPVIYGWCASYDFYVFCQIFGTFMDLPRGYPHYFREIQADLDDLGISDDELPADDHDGVQHNALTDARYILQLAKWLDGIHAGVDAVPVELEKCEG